MKIYLHEYNLGNGEFTCKEFECVETPKQYRLIDKYYNNIVKKQDIGKLNKYYRDEAYLLTDDNSEFKQMLLIKQEDICKQSHTKYKKDLEQLQRLKIHCT